MPQTRSRYVCQDCGSQYPSEYGRCPGCGAWSSLVETVDGPARARPGVSTRTPANSPVSVVDVRNVTLDRLRLPILEFDRVLGGGVVPGSVCLIGGDPGIGKSTLLLQIAQLVAQGGKQVLYVTAEESAEQIKLRAERTGSLCEGLMVLAESDVDAILHHAGETAPALLIIDSIQTVQTAEMGSAAGTVSQVRESTARIAALAKSEGIATFLVGHVTKEGNLAGPKTLEHLVDVVLYLEGDQYHAYRLLRSAKNRFGPANEVGVFDMSGDGLKEVRDPSRVFLSERESGTAGSVITVTFEGSRPLLVEVQALVTPTHFGLPRRTANGIDMNRLVLLTAVLSKRAHLPLASQDVYVNVVGGMRVSEPAVDLAVALAIASSLTDVPVADTIVLGEVGLGGEVRSVGRVQQRLKEAGKLGFGDFIIPQSNMSALPSTVEQRPMGVRNIQEALTIAGCRPTRASAPMGNAIS